MKNKKTIEQIDKEGDKIQIVDWYFPLNNENFMDVTINLNGYIFKGVLKADETEPAGCYRAMDEENEL